MGCVLAANGLACTRGVVAASACGAAASTPDTASAGTAMLARFATFCTRDGRRCRPRLLAFLLVLRWAVEPKNLPSDVSPPGYAANITSRWA